MKHIEMRCPGAENAYLEGFLLTDELTFGQTVERPAVIVCPGGGYVYLCEREAEPVAMAYAAAGFHAFVLRYSVNREAAGFAPLAEISWAIGLLRQNCKQWNIVPDKIAVCGFSAGGHLALSSGLIAENKANAVILGYPVTFTPNLPGMDFMLKLLEGKREVVDSDADKYNLLAKVSKDAPPLFLMATAEDPLTAHCSLPLAAAYSKMGLNYEMHIFQFGPHGYSLATEPSGNGSLRQLNEAVAHWHELSVIWLNRIFGKPVFNDKPVGMMMDYLKKEGLV